MVEVERSSARHVVAFGLVLTVHLIILAGLLSKGMPRRPVFAGAPARLIVERHRPLPEPPPLAVPTLAPPPAFVPMPEIAVAASAPRAPRVVTGVPSAVGTPGHFGAATDTGLGLDVGTVAGGGVGDRGTLAQFEAAVRQRVLAGKRQPALAWDRRNTCVVGYSVHIAAGGRLAGFSIQPCAVPEINEAARAAIEAASYPLPPGSAGADHEVHGSLVFRP